MLGILAIGLVTAVLVGINVVHTLGSEFVLTVIAFWIAAVIGLGWGRAPRRVSMPKTLGLTESSESDREHVVAGAEELFAPETTRRAVTTWIATPTVTTLLSFAAFEVATRLDLFAV